MDISFSQMQTWKRCKHLGYSVGMKKTCIFPKCNSEHHARGYCSLHYRRVLRRGEPGSLYSEFHGKKQTPAYMSWASMKQRCLYVKHKSYDRYGRRGIKICSYFMDFVNFINDMGERPKGYSLDRINNEGNYSCGHCQECIENDWPMNCRWATLSRQGHNKGLTKENSILPGVRVTPQGKFQARIMENGKRKSLGTFNTAEEAYSKYLLSKEEVLND